MKANPVSLRRAGPVDSRLTLRVVQCDRINASCGHNRPSPRAIAQLQVGRLGEGNVQSGNLPIAVIDGLVSRPSSFAGCR